MTAKARPDLASKLIEEGRKGREFFVLVDGWNLVAGSLVQSFGT